MSSVAVDHLFLTRAWAPVPARVQGLLPLERGLCVSRTLLDFPDEHIPSEHGIRPIDARVRHAFPMKKRTG